jgi:hypothetical protein
MQREKVHQEIRDKPHEEERGKKTKNQDTVREYTTRASHPAPPKKF